jgi:transposase
MDPTPVRKDLSAPFLRQAAKVEKDGRVCRRLLGIAHLLESGNRREAEKIACLTQSNFTIWLKRFNAQGIAGLSNKKPSGRPPKLSQPIQEALKAKVLAGPSKAEGIVRYRICDLQKFLQEQYQISMCTSGLWYILHELGLTWKTGRQRHPKSNEESQTAFKKTSSPS